MSKQRKENWLKKFVLIEVCVIAFLTVFYISCGEELYSRTSGGNISEFAATNDVGELTSGLLVEQTYNSQMDSIRSIGVMVSDYGKEIGSTIHISCEILSTGEVIGEQVYGAEDIGVNQYVYLNFEEPRDLLRGEQLGIKITSDAVPGDAPTVLYNVNQALDGTKMASGASFSVNGEILQGTLCFVVSGRDYVWTGPNYWKLALLALAAVAIAFWTAVYRYETGKMKYFFSVIYAVKKYEFLIRQLVSRDFKVRYKRSVLGVFWSFLNPLLLMMVQYLVFSHLFKSDIDNYPVYLLSGVVVFNFFTEATGQALSAIVGNASLISKVYMPKYVYPITRVLSSCINLLMSLIPLIIVAAVTHESFTRAYLMLPYILLCVLGFTMGMGLLLSTLMVFFRDIQFLWGVLSMLWTYLTPIFYPLSIIPQEIRPLFHYNPMYQYVSAVRSIVMEGITPRPVVFFSCTAAAIVMLLVGGMVFKKNQDKFIFYI